MTATTHISEAEGALVLATGVAELASLLTALGGDHVEIPSGGSDWTWGTAEDLERWRDRHGSGPQVARVVVAAWPATAPA